MTFRLWRCLEFRFTCFLRLVKSCRTEQVGNTSAIPTYKHHCHRCHRPSFVGLTYERLGTLLQEVGVKKQLVLGVQSRCIPNSLDARICTCQENKNSNFKIVLTTNDFFVFFLPTLALGSFNLWTKKCIKDLYHFFYPCKLIGSCIDW